MFLCCSLSFVFQLGCIAFLFDPTNSSIQIAIPRHNHQEEIKRLQKIISKYKLYLILFLYNYLFNKLIPILGNERKHLPLSKNAHI